MREAAGVEARRSARCVLMVCDFFYPQFGGIETHILHLSQALAKQGCRVCVLTHAYGDRKGVRYMEGDIKVFYAPRWCMPLSVAAPSIFLSQSLLRSIVVREQVDVVHCHQAFSVLALEAMLAAKPLGCRLVFTDHSLLGLASPGGVLINKLMKLLLSDADRIICVSHIARENTVLRACVPPDQVYAIPNAIDADHFPPRAPAALPAHVCAKHDGVDFVVGGDGPERPVLEDMVVSRGLEGRVRLLGSLEPGPEVGAVLRQAHVFLTTSLTESFCMAAVEAACSGLLVVATAVGGVPEVLPPTMMELAEPNPASVVAAVDRALQRLHLTDPQAQHAQIRGMYNWRDVAERTEAVYEASETYAGEDSLAERQRRYRRGGRLAGLLMCAMAALMQVWLAALSWAMPAQDMEHWPRLAGAARAQLACVSARRGSGKVLGDT
ncbi:unnamed protein product [Pedinophyceae sp. YPF-701]|nr:unnamed protein product [Pedinophyceae sp. YPF-701]